MVNHAQAESWETGEDESEQEPLSSQDVSTDCERLQKVAKDWAHHVSHKKLVFKVINYQYHNQARTRHWEDFVFQSGVHHRNPRQCNRQVLIEFLMQYIIVPQLRVCQLSLAYTKLHGPPIGSPS